jgi:hypothetical protein
MKSLTKALTILLFAALPFSLFGQNMTIVAAFMKVPLASESEYLEVEHTWKKLHQKAVDEGLYQGWQLWRKLHTGVNDPYGYCTLQWYENYEAYLNATITAEWAEELYSLEEQAKIMEKTLSTRDMVSEEVYHMAVGVDNPQAMTYLVIMRNHVPPERSTAYYKMEREIFKPFQEEVIRRGGLAQWGIWNAWPYKEGQAQVVIAEGFKDAKQLTGSGLDMSAEEVLAAVRPDLNWEEVVEEIRKNRKQVSVEVWELVDYVVPEQAAE